MIDIDKYIPKIDKLKHFYLWTNFFLLTSIILGVACLILYIHVLFGVGVSYVATVFTAARKEYKDSKNPNRCAEWLDFWFSILAPTLIMVLIVLTIFA